MPDAVANVTQRPMGSHIPNLNERNTKSPSKRRTQPHDSDSSSKSTLTDENIRLHNALESQENSSDLPDDPVDTQAMVEPGSSSSRTSSPGPDSSHEHETPNETHHTPFDSGLNSTDLDCELHPNHVHFRPRVRITSGIGRHRHKHSPRTPDRYLSPSSTRSTSPSSSISAPLRTRTDDEADKPGWGPLGQRVSLFSRDRRRTSREPHRKKRYDNYLAACEQTPLLRARLQSSTAYAEGRREQGLWDPDRAQEAWVSTEVDRVFGTMPWRLLNHHWWWWQLEPVLCCTCLEESDVES